MNTIDKMILARIYALLTIVETLFNRLSADAQNEPFNTHAEGKNLPHCIRWGAMAANELCHENKCSPAKDYEIIIECLPKVRVFANCDTREVFINDIQVMESVSQKIVNHSADGFNWGYGGSGPAQFALAVLCEYLPYPVAQAYYQTFKSLFIANYKMDKNIDTEWDLSQMMRETMAFQDKRADNALDKLSDNDNGV